MARMSSWGLALTWQENFCDCGVKNEILWATISTVCRTDTSGVYTRL